MNRLDAMAAAVGPRFAIVVSEQGRPIDARLAIRTDANPTCTADEAEALRLARLAFEGDSN